jgi:hypothetical protein
MACYTGDPSGPLVKTRAFGMTSREVKFKLSHYTIASHLAALLRM